MTATNLGDGLAGLVAGLVFFSRPHQCRRLRLLHSQLPSALHVLGELLVLRHAVAGQMPLAAPAPASPNPREALAESTVDLSTHTPPIRPHETGSIPARAAM